MVTGALIAGAVVAGGASLLSASKQASAAKDAAQTQAESANRAAELQQQQYEQTRADLAPWREAGGRALTGLEALTAQPLQAPPPYSAPAPIDPSQYQFRAPTAADLTQDPGYQFRLSEGRRLLEGGAAARGLLQSGGTLRGVTDLGQQLASQEYQNVYNRRLAENQQNYQRAGTQNYDQYQRGLGQYLTNIEVPLQLRRQGYNELAGLSQTGQVTGQQLGQFGQQAASNIGNLYTSAGSALSAGEIRSANAYSQGLQGVGNAVQGGLSNYLLYKQLQQPGYGTLPTQVPQYGYGGVSPVNPWQF